MDGDAGPDPTDVEVYANQCDADCYAKAFEDFEFIERFEPQYEQQVNTTCESVWRAKQALDYEFYSSGFLYEGLLPERANLPQWLQEELNTVETNSVDEAEIDTILAECRICNPSVSVASVVDVPTQDTEVPAPAPSPVAALSPMPVIAIPPIVNPPTANVPEPSAIPEPLPSPSPSQQVAPSQEKSAGDRAHHNIITMAVIATVMIKIVVYW